MCLDTVGQVVGLPESQLAEVQFTDAVRQISLVLLAAEDIDVRPGDWLRTHTGLATQVLTDAEASRMRFRGGDS